MNKQLATHETNPDRRVTIKPMQRNYRICAVNSLDSLQAVWAPGALVHQPIKLNLGALRLSTDCFTLLKRQATSIVFLCLNHDFIVSHKSRQDLFETILMFGNCKTVLIWHYDGLNLRDLYRLCYRSPISKSLVVLRLFYVELDSPVVCHLAKALEQGRVMKKFYFSGFSFKKTDLSLMLFYVGTDSKDQTVCFCCLKLALYVAESLDARLLFRSPHKESLLTEKTLGFLKSLVSTKLQIQ